MCREIRVAIIGADNFENGKAIYGLAKGKHLKVFSASSLRFVPQLKKAK